MHESCVTREDQSDSAAKRAQVCPASRLRKSPLSEASQRSSPAVMIWWTGNPCCPWMRSVRHFSCSGLPRITENPRAGSCRSLTAAHRLSPTTQMWCHSFVTWNERHSLVPGRSRLSPRFVAAQTFPLSSSRS